ncbi:hypothetical protein [Sphingobacterium thalpophilum]|uniref:hypothetical protein n=1 Tax=Sphingobacterium thalpophilum TaxID=259 RepID=UPI002D7A235F|nr:hypothetical protein [Sphingobacterium thalpophilum]
MYILSTTVGFYFERVHNLRIENSNALYVLERLKHFEKIHLDYKDDFTPFRGVHYNTILEMVRKAIQKIERSHQNYIAKGYVITEEIKQYDIDSLIDSDPPSIDNKTLIIIKEHIQEGVIKGITSIFNPDKTQKKNKDAYHIEMEKKNLKKLSKK